MLISFSGLSAMMILDTGFPFGRSAQRNRFGGNGKN
jgi:hypothetical protein